MQPKPENGRRDCCKGHRKKEWSAPPRLDPSGVSPGLPEKLPAGLSQGVVARSRDAQEPKVDEAFCEGHNLWSASVEIKIPILCRLGAFQKSGPRGRWRVPILRGV